MSVYVFSGPTLSIEEAQCELDAIYLPPVSQGDVYRVARSRPVAIGIIDGLFENVPAVWHKEILWAMSQGVHMFGAASMGALRAAELAPFGMVGVGWIFEAFRDGILEDDDEVAVVHGSAEDGFRPLSEAMVNIRRTLAAAETAGVIRPATRARLESIAKSFYYPDRSWPAVLDAASKQGSTSAELVALRGWLGRGRVDQKREDALLLLRVMREQLAAGLPPKRVEFVFSHTTYWDQLVAQAGGFEGAEGGATTTEAILNEARLEGDTFARARQTAMLRDLLLAAAERAGYEPEPEAVAACGDHLAVAHQLGDQTDLGAWLAANDLTIDQFEGLLRDEVKVGWAAQRQNPALPRRLVEVLRLTGDYARLRSRAVDKAQTLRLHGLENLSADDAGITTEQLLAWYFGRLGDAVPADLDTYATAAGFANLPTMLHAIVREFFYVRVIGDPESPTAREVDED